MDKKWIYKHPTILFDFDNVLCDTTKHCLEYYNKAQGTNLKIEDIKSYDLSQYGDWKIFSKIYLKREIVLKSCKKLSMTEDTIALLELQLSQIWSILKNVKSFNLESADSK